MYVAEAEVRAVLEVSVGDSQPASTREIIGQHRGELPEAGTEQAFVEFNRAFNIGHSQVDVVDACNRRPGCRLLSGGG